MMRQAEVQPHVHPAAFVVVLESDTNGKFSNTSEAVAGRVC
jgi:hypothetical protein